MGKKCKGCILCLALLWLTCCVVSKNVDIWSRVYNTIYNNNNRESGTEVVHLQYQTLSLTDTQFMFLAILIFLMVLLGIGFVSLWLRPRCDAKKDASGPACPHCKQPAQSVSPAPPAPPPVVEPEKECVHCRATIVQQAGAAPSGRHRWCQLPTIHPYMENARGEKWMTV